MQLRLKRYLCRVFSIHIHRSYHSVIFLVLFLSLFSNVHAQQNGEAELAGKFEQYVSALRNEAQKKGYEKAFIDKAFADITFRPTVIKSDKNQPERKITLDSYLSTRVPDWKVKRAVALYEDNKTLLERVAKDYGVQARFIVALWGNESNFGKIQGNYSVLSALASLAFEGRREKLFKDNFFAALTLLNEGHAEISDFKGSWAGAMGQTQFMPISFATYAVDYDDDGKKDIWNTKADVFASIANFLASEGWTDDGTWGRQVKLTQPISVSGLSKANMKPLRYWHKQGVKRFDGRDLPEVDVKASLIMPDGENGRIYLVYNNFHTLMKWNRSSYFGVSVGYLSERVKRGY